MLLLAASLLSGLASAAPLQADAWTAPFATTQGVGEVQIAREGTQLTYTVTTQGQAQVERAFVRVASDYNAPVLILERRGDRLEGTLTADALRGALKDDSLADLTAALDSGAALVTVHVDGLPAGVVQAPVARAGMLTASN